MRVAICHYHLRPGGVTRVIDNTLRALQQAPVDIVVLTGEAPPEPLPCDRVLTVPELGYAATVAATDGGRLQRQLLATATAAFGASPDLWHFHNHSLGKTPAVPEAVRHLALDGHRILLQIHDFPEDGRPGDYQRLQAAVGGDGADPGGRLYPDGAHVHYAMLNGRDRAFLQQAGLPAARAHLLANPVSLGSELDSETSPAAADVRRLLYPTRAIRRKNLGEFLLLSLLGEDRLRYGVTMAPRNPAARPGYERWVRLARELDLAVDFEVGADTTMPFPELLKRACGTVTTSVAEGFGLAFLEPWLAERPVWGRNLPEITAEFAAAGVDLGRLYERLEIPVDWIGRRRLADLVERSLPPFRAAYGASCDGSHVGRALKAWLRAGHVDFGRLDESLQEHVLRRVATSVAARRRLADYAPGQVPIGPERVAGNRDAVRQAFGLRRYRDRLLAVYRALAAAEPEELRHLSGRALLDAFLAPERFWALRTS